MSKTAPQENSRPALRPLSNPWLYFWVFMLGAGFIYVAGVLCGRSMPLYSRHGGYGELIKLLISAPILFWLGPMHAFAPLESGWRKVLLDNVVAVGLSFFIALHWLYLQEIDAINYSLTPSDVARMGVAAWVVFTGGAVLTLGLGAYHLVLARRQGILMPYILSFTSAVMVIVLISWTLRGRASVHIHHYFLFGFFIPFLRFRNLITLICLGGCAGVYVEGISEWSMALLWDFH